MTSMTKGTKPGDPIWRIMSPRMTAVDKNESLLTVARELATGEIGAVLVASPGTATGMISERDIIAFVADGSDLATIQAGEVMTGDLVVASPQDTIESVGRLMLEAGVRHIPVREGDRLVGVVSMRDVLAVLLPIDEPATGVPRNMR